MARLVIGRDLLIPLVDHVGTFLHAHDYLDGGFLHLGHGDGLEALAGGQERRLVEQVLQIRAGKAGSGFRNGRQVHVRGNRLASGVYLQDFFSALDVRVAHHNLAVEPARTHQGGVQNVRAVGGRDHDDTFVGTEAVHFHKQLV